MRSNLIRQLCDDLLSALSLLTRLPIPAHQHSGARSAWAWPLAGLLTGLFGAGLIFAGSKAGLAPGPLAAMALAAMALATGGLHEDGLADSADGMFGGRSPEQRLEIMKDSRSGAYGVLALVLVSLCSWSALSALIASERALLALPCAAALSRAPMALLMAWLPAARKNGISAASGRPSPAVAALAAALAAGLVVASLGREAMPLLAGAALVTLLTGLWAKARIGGQTGDILGAAQQLSFALILALLA